MDDLQPSRPWDELVAVSIARGRALRRRRNVRLSLAPIAGVAVLVTGLSLAPGTHDESLVQLPGGPTPSPHVSGRSAANTAVTPQVNRTNAGASAPRDGGASTAPPAAGPTAAVPLPDVARGTAVFRTQTVRIDDPAGDGVVSGNDDTGVTNPTGPVANDPALDILRLQFDATERGITMTMTLGGAYRHDGTYNAYFTDAKTGCTLTVFLGGKDADGYYDSCDAAGAYNYLPPVVDPSDSILRATIPWAYLPRDVDARHVMTGLKGLTRATDAAGAHPVCDRATTTATFGPFAR